MATMELTTCFGRPCDAAKRAEGAKRAKRLTSSMALNCAAQSSSRDKFCKLVAASA
eukprot:CAMPEP_0178384868 /NCGR_PEP_ID=MMETSP0689_2-20121128/7739_1 /TAXON_ID=160604 /ORGANISM="Amphidinium massartii, Strain CS-259" /LENGTH=55 /DNA_ID=CAMNT_0020005133 /DNA_START=451 /DNA_END=618 /DNA_ORIENTATION=-